MAYRLPTGVVPYYVSSDSDSEPDMAPPQPADRPRSLDLNEVHDEFDYVGWATAFWPDERPGRMEDEAQGTARELDMQDQAVPDLLTEDECLHRILEMFPDIAHDHVRKLYRAKFTYGIEIPDPSTVAAWCNELSLQLSEPAKYPKERERRQELKRKREESNRDDATEFEKENREAVDQSYLNAAQRLLQDEFLQVPVKFIREKLQKHQFLIKAYAVIEAAERNHDTGQQQRSYRKVRARAPRPALTENSATMKNGALARELAAARRRRNNKKRNAKKTPRKLMPSARTKNMPVVTKP
ncbi:hypothetical protein H2199_001886 [Coniosporium tulheliwenetii]|uniref:Uncharacterized protein n=1 Tax=Coniosporium tulheliwenetii TaxID=3383036 RepID=A0ACC2ZKL6_9PEZI|nr:hypothetical protein H2199_001886 [Cladosporium sp. JES 115]